MSESIEHKLSMDEFAMALLQHLKEKGDTSYRNLELSISEELDCHTRSTVGYYIELLRTAELIELEPDPLNTGNEIIKLTEIGRNLRYEGVQG